MTFVYIIFLLVALYLAAGLVFAVFFVTSGVTKIDESAAGSKWGFRLIIIPGTMVFWPLLLRKWLRAMK